MTFHVSSAAWATLDQSFPTWQAQYPKFDTMMASGASHVAALRYLGIALWQDGHLVDAAKVLTMAAEWAPTEPVILGELGSLLCALGRGTEALDCLTRSLTLDQNQYSVWLTAGCLCQSRGDLAVAEQAFMAALELRPDSADALAGLGLVCFEKRQLSDAVRHLTAAVSRGAQALNVHASLGQAHYLLGDFRQASESLQAAASACPDDPNLLRRCALAEFIDALQGSTVEEAIAGYRSRAGDQADDIETVCTTAFQALCGFGHHAPAIRLGKYLLQRMPGDPIIRHHLDALRGKQRAVAPLDYVTASFDRFAPGFEQHLVGVLGYDLPAKCQALLVDTGRRFSHALDLGCGTGLAASFLAGMSDVVSGVDASAGMLAQAQEKTLYASLVQADMLAYLAQGEERFDLVVCLDVAIYQGDLRPLFDAVAHRLTPGGLFAISVETGEGQDYRFLPSGRFAHDPAYVEGVSRESFRPVATLTTVLRLEANKPIHGKLLLLERGL